MERQTEQAELQALIGTLDKQPDFDSAHVGGLIGFAVQRAQLARDRAEAARAACCRAH